MYTTLVQVVIYDTFIREMGLEVLVRSTKHDFPPCEHRLINGQKY